MVLMVLRMCAPTEVKHQAGNWHCAVSCAVQWREKPARANIVKSTIGSR
jgi:hypothetical protein